MEYTIGRWQKEGPNRSRFRYRHRDSVVRSNPVILSVLFEDLLRLEGVLSFFVGQGRQNSDQ